MWHGAFAADSFFSVEKYIQKHRVWRASEHTAWEASKRTRLSKTKNEHTTPSKKHLEQLTFDGKPKSIQKLKPNQNSSHRTRKPTKTTAAQRKKHTHNSHSNAMHIVIIHQFIESNRRSRPQKPLSPSCFHPASLVSQQIHCHFLTSVQALAPAPSSHRPDPLLFFLPRTYETISNPNS